MQSHNSSNFSVFSTFNIFTLLSAQGRLSRTGFLAYHILLYVLVGLIVLKLNHLSLTHLEPKALLHLVNTQHGTVLEQFPVLRGIVPILCGIYFSFCLSIQRLHDLNHNGYRSVLLLIPIINLMLMLYLLCAEGCNRANRFGHPSSSRVIEGCILVMSLSMLIMSPIILRL